MNLLRWRSFACKLGLSVFALSCFTILALAAGKSASNHATQAADVRIDNFTFHSTALTVPVGTQVTWTNRDDIPHTVVSENKLFKSQALDTDDRFSFTFTHRGTYHYFCSLHPRMTAEVIVK